MEPTTELTEPVDSLVTWMKRLAVGVLLLVASLAIGLAVVFSVSSSRASQLERTTEKLTEATRALKAQQVQAEKDRIERSVGNCKQLNATQIRDHDSLTRKIQKVLGQFRVPQQVIDSFDEEITPLRDCTPEGIKKYNEAHGL